MAINLEPEQQRLIGLVIQSGAFHDSREVIATALAMLAEQAGVTEASAVLKPVRNSLPAPLTQL